MMSTYNLTMANPAMARRGAPLDPPLQTPIADVTGNDELPPRRRTRITVIDLLERRATIEFAFDDERIHNSAVHKHRPVDVRALYDSTSIRRPGAGSGVAKIISA